MPYPQNLETARAVESIVRSCGAVPATVAVLDGVDPAGQEGRAVADAVHLVDDGNRRIAGQHEIAMQGMDVEAVRHRSLRGDQRLADHLAAEDALAALVRYHWPGNIRQMRNVMRTALALCEDSVIRLADLPAEITDHAETSRADAGGGSCNSEAASANPLDCAERAALLSALDENRWNITNTASQLSMSRNTLYRKMKKHEIPPSRER